MTVQSDAQLGFKKESVYGTAVTPDTFLEFIDADFDWQPTFAQGRGFRAGQRLPYANRRQLVKEEVSGTLQVEAHTKGLGKLFEAAMGGTGTSTLISGSAYQQLFVPTTTDFLSSYTFQLGVPPLGGAAAIPTTFAGMVCDGWELTASNGEIPLLKFDFFGRSLDTATALAVASYIADDALLSFVGGSLVIGGSVTPPTTNALASGGTATSNVRDISVKWSNGLDTNGFNIGSAGKRSRKQALGARGITGEFTAEWDSTTYRDAYLAQTDLALVLTFAHSAAISGSNYPTLQITIPDIRLEGELVKPANDEVHTQSIGFTGLDGRVAAHPVYVAIVTAETAI